MNYRKKGIKIYNGALKIIQKWPKDLNEPPFKLVPYATGRIYRIRSKRKTEKNKKDLISEQNDLYFIALLNGFIVDAKNIDGINTKKNRPTNQCRPVDVIAMNNVRFCDNTNIKQKFKKQNK